MPTKDRNHMEERMTKLFGSTSRPRILDLLLSHPQQIFYPREIIYKTGLSLQAVQRELGNFLCLGILKRRETKARIYYQIDMTSPWFKPLRGIFELFGREEQTP